jgi:hypothetical protein
MKPKLTILLVLTIASGSLFAADDAPVKGAKELFFDPTDGSVVSATQPNALTAQPTPAPGHAGKSAVGPKKATAKPQLVQSGSQQPPNNAVARREPVKLASNKPSSTLGLSYWIEIVHPDGKGQQVTDSRIFRSGERIRLHFRSNCEGYIALIQLGSSGTSTVLFPDPAKGVADNLIAADEDRILPKETAWFRFDNTPGTEKILALFGRSHRDLDTFEIKPQMDAATTQAVMKTAEGIRGGKDLILETETEKASEIGTYAVNLAGKPVVLEIQLRHQ